MLGLRRRGRDEGYPAGSCTRWCWQICPWVPLRWGDAWQWADSARAAGLEIVYQPRVNAVAVFGRNTRFGDLGHVAPVVQIDSGGVFWYLDGFPMQQRSVDWHDAATQNQIQFIVPPADWQRELPRGRLHNGRGDANDPIVQTMQAWDGVGWYFGYVAWQQSLKIELLALELGRL